MKYASFWRRLIAGTIDVIIAFFFAFLLLWPYGRLSAAYGKWAGSFGFPLWFSFLWGQVVWNTYFVYFIGRKGQGIGGRIFHVEVISSATRSKPTYKQAIIRQAMFFLASCFSGIVYIGGIIQLGILVIDVLWMLRDPNKQMLHDKLAETIVIKTGLPEISGDQNKAEIRA